jgi:hypothetical protein
VIFNKANASKPADRAEMSQRSERDNQHRVSQWRKTGAPIKVDVAVKSQ